VGDWTTQISLKLLRKLDFARRRILTGRRYAKPVADAHPASCHRREVRRRSQWRAAAAGIGHYRAGRADRDTCRDRRREAVGFQHAMTNGCFGGRSRIGHHTLCVLNAEAGYCPYSEARVLVCGWQCPNS
jgi:hypothetical protein